MIDSLERLVALMASHGAVRFYAKKLSPNDNSKNQIYLGGDFSALNVIPNHGVYTDSDGGGYTLEAELGISPTAIPSRISSAGKSSNTGSTTSRPCARKAPSGINGRAGYQATQPVPHPA